MNKFICGEKRDNGERNCKHRKGINDRAMLWKRQKGWNLKSEPKIKTVVIYPRVRGVGGSNMY